MAATIQWGMGASLDRFHKGVGLAITIVNKPSGGAERYDANQLGIRALPLPPFIH
jgi:hypothetical protein